MLFACASQVDAAPLLLTHATVIDGTGAAPRAGTTILIEGQRIAAVYPDGSRTLPKDVQVRDLSGRFVIPGLIDAHVHLTDAEPDIAHYQAFLRALLMGGVTTVRDMAGNDRLLAWLAQQTDTGAFAGPDIYFVALMAGPSFFAEDSRVQDAAPGELVGTAPWMKAIDDKSDLPFAIAEAKGTGATAIKIYANLSAGLVRSIAVEAHRQGLRVWTHATIFPAKPGDAVAAGADTISHSPYLVWEAAPTVPDDYGLRAKGDFAHVRPDDPRILALFDAMKQRGTILDATLLAFRETAERHPEKVGENIMPWSYAVTRLAHERGVRIDAGTDGQGLPDASDKPDLDAMPDIHAEMALLVEHCGFTPLEALRAATQVGADAAGQADVRGTIAPGMRADLVVLTADPSVDIHNTTRISMVVKNGTVFQRGR
jgi:imidazolonepropionase-like amidohydrolase